MTRVFEMSPPEKGPGSAFQGSYWARRRKETDNNNAQRTTFIGEELLEWHDDENASSTKKKRSKNRERFKQKESSKSKGMSSFLKRRVIASNSDDCSTSLPCRALAVDTRCFEGFDPDLERRFREFFCTLVARGATPSFLCKIIAGRSVETCDLREEAKVREIMIEPDLLFPAVAIPSAKSGENYVVPKELAAKRSWTVMAEMVSDIVQTAANDPSSVFPPVPPLEVTIVTTDLALLADTDESFQKEGAQTFLDEVTPYFHEHQVGEIRIVVGKTGLAARSPAGDDLLMQAENEEGGDQELVSKQQCYDLSLAKCIHAIQALLGAKSGESLDFHLVPEQASSDFGSRSVNVSLDMIDHTVIGYKYLSRKWIRSSPTGQSLVGQIELDLPELLDGTKCSISLEVAYKTLPFPINSTDILRLRNDLKLLSQSKVDACRALPFSSLDASLLYGVPMTARAGLEDDFEQTQVMTFLVKSLLKLLQERGLALLVTAETPASVASAVPSPLFHLQGKQTLVLMPQEQPKSSPSGMDDPVSGLLFYYAGADNLLSESSGFASGPWLDSHSELLYSDYIEQAMELLEIQPNNPLDVSTLEEEAASTKEKAFHAAFPGGISEACGKHGDSALTESADNTKQKALPFAMDTDDDGL